MKTARIDGQIVSLENEYNGNGYSVFKFANGEGYKRLICDNKSAETINKFFDNDAFAKPLFYAGTHTANKTRR